MPNTFIVRGLPSKQQQQADDEPDRVPIAEEEQGGKTRAIVR